MIIDLDPLFPEDLADETVCTIAELLNHLAMQWESRYFHRIRAYQARQQLDLFDAEKPWQQKVLD